MQVGGRLRRLFRRSRPEQQPIPLTTPLGERLVPRPPNGSAERPVEGPAEKPGTVRETQVEAPWWSNHPPRWLGRALAMSVLAVFIGIGVWNAMRSVAGVAVNLLLSVFVALVLEPTVVWLVRHGWRRGVAAGAAIFGSIVLIVGVLALFGNLFVQQAIALFQAVPDVYEQVVAWLESQFGLDLPGVDEVIGQATHQWGDDLASGALVVGRSLVSAIFAAATILLVTYYLLAAGPRFRAAVCGYLRPTRQQEVLRLWEITQGKVSDFMNSRILLAAICTVATSIFLLILGTPYALPLALFTGLVSQFVPTIGTYIGGALPVLVALTTQGVVQALLIVAFVVAYQQVENLWLSPKVSAKALEMNPAVAFVVVIAFGAVFGALGAFLALPIAATIQAVWNTYVERHELVDSHMLRDPESPSAARQRNGV